MKLFEHQKTGIEFLKKTKKCILADEMGLGKTRQAVISGSEESKKGIMVVCPASLKVNWDREILEVYPEEETQIIDSTTKNIDEEKSWYIINYDILKKFKEEIEVMIDFNKIDTIILDEAHYIKGKSMRAKLVIEMCQRKEIKNVYALTGTPIMNRPIELFNILKAIEHPLGEKRTFYSKRYCGAHLRVLKNGIRFMDEKGATNLGELRSLIKRSILRRKKEEVLDLPKKIISVMESQMSREWRIEYDNAWDNYLLFLAEYPTPEKNIDNIMMARQLVELQKLKQVCSYSKVDRIVADISNAIDQGEKIIVFTQYTKTLEQISEKVRKLKIKKDGKNVKVECVTLSGKDKMEARQESVDRFQENEDTKVFVLNIKAGGVGLTLTAGSIVMFADMDWSPEVHSQAEDRAHRIGQNSMVNVYYYMVPETIEEDIVGLLTEKKKVIDEILDGKKETIKHTSVAEEFLRRMGQKLPTVND